MYTARAMQQTPPACHQVPRWIPAALAALAAAWCVLRLCWLETSPPGLSMDEALAGLHVRCLAETGRSADGARWPLFPSGLGGGLYTPTYITALFGWTRLFGYSIGSIRGMNSAFSIVTIVGLWFLARQLAGSKTAWLVTLAACLSPWSFVLSRLGADAPIAPAFLVWGTFFFLRSSTMLSATLGGVFFSLAAYSYPPTRVQAPLLVLLLLFIVRKDLTPKRLFTFLAAGFVLSLPLLKRLADGTLLRRSEDLSIFTRSYVDSHRGALSRPVFMIKQVLENLHEHLRPSFLVFTGDPNLRHSTQRIGELGWLDTFALALAAAGIVLLICRSVFRAPAIEHRTDQSLWRIAVVAIVVGAFGILPAALCWEGLPHAYRSIGAYPAVALFTGVCLSACWNRWRLVPIVALALAVGQTAAFFPDYFGEYRSRASDAFDTKLRQAAEGHDKEGFERLARGYPALGFRYYLVQNFGHTCGSSTAEAKRILAAP